MKKHVCYKTDCNNLIEEGGLCQKHIEEYDADEAQRQSEIRDEQAAADYLFGVRD